MIDKAQARHEISKLIYGYAEALDSGDLAQVGELFSHAVMLPSASPPVRGSDGVQGMFAEHTIFYDDEGPADPYAEGTKPHTRHCVTNLVIDVDDKGQTARARSYVIVFLARPDFPLQPVFRNAYHDRFECVDGQWRFVERKMLLDEFQGDTSKHLYQTPRTR